MTTNFSTIKFALSKFYCRGVSHEKQRFWTILLSAHKTPPPQKRKLCFYCRLAVSDSVLGPSFVEEVVCKENTSCANIFSTFIVKQNPPC